MRHKPSVNLPNDDDDCRNDHQGRHRPPDRELIIFVQSATDETEVRQVIEIILAENSKAVAFFVRRKLVEADIEIMEDILTDVWREFSKALRKVPPEPAVNLQQLLLELAVNRLGHFIYINNYKFVEQYVSRKLSSQTAEIRANIVAEVWSGLMIKLKKPDFRFKGSYRYYLRGIARYKIKDFFQDHYDGVEPGSRVSIAADLSGDALIFSDDDPDGMTFWERLSGSEYPFSDPALIMPILDQYERAWQRLEVEYPTYYQVLRLYVEEELTDQQIASQLNLSPSNVRARISRARDKFRDFLQDEQH